MTTQCEMAALAVQVPQLGCCVSRTGGQKVARGVKGAAPGGLAVTTQCQHAAAMKEIPETHLQEERCRVNHRMITEEQKPS